MTSTRDYMISLLGFHRCIRISFTFTPLAARRSRELYIRKMSSPAFLTTLNEPVQSLVNGASTESDYFRKSDTDKAEVVEWVEKVSKGAFSQEVSLKDLDSQLISRTYIVSNHLTAADVALYGALHPVLSSLPPAQHYSHSSLTRYFDHIQSRPSVQASVAKLSAPLSAITFDIDNAPKPERKIELPKVKKDKAATKAVGVTASTSEAAAAVPAEAKTGEPTEGKAQKKEKKEKKKDGATADGSGKQKAGGGAKPVAEDAGDPVPSMIDLRVGRIVDIMKHPDADGLYVEQIDIGEETGPRTVVSGLVNYIPIEQMRDKYLVAVCNLKPANMRGVKSFAMVLCATSKDGKDSGIELIQPPANSKPGDRVYFEGANFESATPLVQLNPKKKIFETVQPGFITLDSKEAAWVDPVTKSVHKIRTKEGVCLAPTLVGASLS